jgi:hypothetical protein
MTGAQAVAMASQFFEHPQAVERGFGGVMKNVKPNKVDMQILLSIHDIKNRFQQ